MKSYNHFTQMDICCLFYLLQLGTSQTQIARTLNKHRSSVSRLIKRCPGGNFNPEVSYENYLENRKKCIRKHRVQKGTELFEFIQEKLYEYWSPEIIALKWNEKHKDESISFNTIYSTIKNGVFEKISAQTHLRRRGKQKYGHRSQYCTIQPDKTIHDLPEEAKYRERLNDWEGDTIRTTPGKGCIVTLLDRKSRFLLAKSVDKVSSEKVCNAIKEAFNET